MAFSIFSPKKPSHFSERFTEWKSEWSETLTKNCLPLLRRSLGSAASDSELKENVNSVLQELVLHYKDLDDAADINTVTYLLFPSRGLSLESPFLFLGDIHPYVLTNLLRRFISTGLRGDDKKELRHISIDLDLDSEHQREIATAWKDPSAELMTRIDQIECRVRLMGHDLLERMRIAQRRFVTRVSENWMSSHHSQEGGKKKKPITEMTMMIMEEDLVKTEMVSIFVDANRLRKSVLTSIVEVMNEHQAVLFLEGLCQILVGFNDQVLNDGEAQKRDDNILMSTFMNGVMAVPSYMVYLGHMSLTEIAITAYVFTSAVIGAAASTFVSATVKGRDLRRTAQDGIWAASCFFFGGLLPLCTGLIVKEKWVKIVVTIILTAVLLGLAIAYRGKNKGYKERLNLFVLWLVTFVVITITVGFADRIHRLREKA